VFYHRFVAKTTPKYPAKVRGPLVRFARQTSSQGSYLAGIALSGPRCATSSKNKLQVTPFFRYQAIPVVRSLTNLSAA
jgi:hypothetical protein